MGFFDTLGDIGGGFSETFTPTLQSIRSYKQRAQQAAFERSLQQERSALEQERFALDRQVTEAKLAEAKEVQKRSETTRADQERYIEIQQQLQAPKPSGKDVTAGVSVGRKVNLPALGENRALQREAIGLRTKLGFDVAPEEVLFPTSPKSPNLQRFERPIAGGITQVGTFNPQTGEETITGTFKTSEKVSNETFTERGIAKILNPNTPIAERKLLERKIFPQKNGKVLIDGISLADIKATLNLIYPLDYDERPGVPEDVDPNSYEFLVHGAELIKQGVGTTALKAASGGFVKDEFKLDKKYMKKQ